MDFIKNNFLLIPLFFLLMIFAVDKIAFIPKVKNSIMYWKKIEPLLYESREKLFVQLQRDYDSKRSQNQKSGLILGTSRSGEFDTDYIKKYMPDTYTYNFSAPFGSVAYYYYWLDRILEKNMKPAYVLLEIDAVVMSAQAINYQLSYSFDMGFVITHTDINRPRLKNPWKQTGKGFSVADADKYYLKQLFGFYKYPLKLGNIRENQEKKFMPSPDGRIREIRLGEWRENAMPFIDQVNEKKLGGIPNFFFVKLSSEDMKKDAVNTASRNLAHYRAAPTQVVFLKNILNRLAHENIPVLIYVPYVNPIYYKFEKRTDKVYDINKRFRQPFLALLKELHKKNKMKMQIIDLNRTKKMECRKFTDSYHLSGQCFPELTDHLFTEFSKQLN